MTLRSRLNAPALLSTALFLSGCAGAGTRFYTVDAAPSTASSASPYAGPPIRVDAVHIPPALDRTELIQDLANGQVAVSDTDHWVAPLGELMRRAITQDLASRLPADKTIFPEAPKPTTASGIVIDVLSFSRQNGEAVIQVSWTLTPGHSVSAPTRPPVMYERALQLSTPTSSASASGAAGELSRLLGQLADRIAADLPRPQT